MSNVPGMNYVFDATQIEPDQGGSIHPIGIFDALISDAKITPTKDGNAGMYVLTFKTAAGTIDRRHNLWNPSPQAVDIAQRQLSATCHVTGIFKVDMNNGGKALIGGRCKIDVKMQLQNGQPHPNGYTEVSRVLDQNGNPPGKTGQQAPQQPAGAFGQQPAQPVQQQPGFGQQPAFQPGPNFGAPGGNPAPQQAPQQAPQWQQPQQQPAQPAAWGGNQPATNPAWGNPQQPQQPQTGFQQPQQPVQQPAAMPQSAPWGSPQPQQQQPGQAPAGWGNPTQ